MFPFAIKPEAAVQELRQYNEKLAAGMKTLSELGPISEGVSPKEAVYEEDKLVLYHYAPRVEKPHRIPVLIVYALVNRPYVADLQEDRSLIRGLLDQGLDVYLIDWGYPDSSDRYQELDDYINGYIRHCVNFISDRYGLDSINILGICQGGTFSTCFTALYPKKVRNLVTVVTPIDFHSGTNLLGSWGADLDVDLIVDTMGNVPGDLLNFTFLSMSPYRLTNQKYLDLIPLLDQPDQLMNFLRMEKWIFDSPDQPGETFRQFVKDFFQNNRLIKDEVRIGGKRVELKNITMPVFNVYATKDHLVPPAGSQALGKYARSSDYSEFPFKGGHIGIFTSSRSMKEVPPAIANWIKERG